MHKTNIISALAMRLREDGLTPEMRSEWRVIEDACQAAAQAPNRIRQVQVLWEVIARTAAFARAFPDDARVWALRACVAGDLDYTYGGWWAGQNLKRLGRTPSDSSDLALVFAKLEEKGWMEGVEPRREWSGIPLAGIRALAEEGDLEASVSLGRWYEEGTLLGRDLTEAQRWFRKAAEGGDERAWSIVEAMDAVAKRTTELWSEAMEATLESSRRVLNGSIREAGQRAILGGQGGPVVAVRWVPAGIYEIRIPQHDLVSNHEPPDGAHAVDGLPRVTLTQGYWMAETLCTQFLWESVLRESTNWAQCVKAWSLPKIDVSWEEAARFCRMLTEDHRDSGILDAHWAWRLPTEAEWEYAWRSGSANASVTSSKRSGRPDRWDVLRYPAGYWGANAWGLRDMEGSAIYQWCQDRYGPYSTVSVIDPVGPKSGFHRVLRQGANCGRGGIRGPRTGLGPDRASLDKPLIWPVGFRPVLGSVK